MPVLLAVLASQGANATIVVVIRSPTDIVVGTYGLSQRESDAGDQHAVCKIHRVDDRTFFSTTGTRTFVPSGFDVVSLIRETLAGNGVGDEARRNFDNAVGEALAREMLPASEADYRAAMSRGMFVEVLIFRILGSGVSELEEHQFAIPPDGKRGRMDVVTTICPPDCDAGATMIHAYGYVPAVQAVKAAWVADANFFRKARPRGDVDVIDELVKVAIAARPDACGTPISILRLTAKGAQWVEQGECAREHDTTKTPAPAPAPR